MGTCLSIVEDILAASQAQKDQGSSGGGGAAPSSSYSGGVSPVYSQLPSGAEEHPVRNVYDGDTLTLKDERRVRFLGVDTPELKDKQPFAQEAKDYTKSKISDSVYLVIEDKDHYDRLLASVYVQADGGYLCVNEGLVHEGFAFAYIPDKNSKPFNWDKLIKLQAGARNSKRGVWSSFVDADVVATANGSAYHNRSCEHISNIRNLTELKVSEATDRGLHPCRTCMG